jgi:LytS/YehU family sensor histidine kinase
MLSSIFAMLLAVLVPYVVGVLTKALTNLAKAADSFRDSPSALKRFVVVIISTVLTAVFAWAGVQIDTPLVANAEQIGVLAAAVLTGLSSLVSAVYAMIAHTGDKVAAVTPSRRL